MAKIESYMKVLEGWHVTNCETCDDENKNCNPVNCPGWIPKKNRTEILNQLKKVLKQKSKWVKGKICPKCGKGKLEKASCAKVNNEHAHHVYCKKCKASNF